MPQRVDTARRTTRAAAAALGVVALLAVGALAGMVFAPERAPQAVTTTSGPLLVDVAAQAFDDVRQVAVTPQELPGVPLVVRDRGMVTRSVCAPGATITSGRSPVTMDDRPVVALATSQPLWRDLTAGARGADVGALQTELARLGYDVAPDGRYGRSTERAVAALLADTGVERPTGALSAASVLWLPAPEVVVDTCEALLGESLGDDPFATTASTLTSLTIGVAADAVPGARVVRAEGVTAPLDDDGRVTDPAFLAALAASPTYQFSRAAEGEAAQPRVEFALADPVDASVVPPAALYDLTAGQGCVLGDGEPRVVEIVASALGRTLVVFPDGAPPARVEVSPAEPVPCR